MLHCYHILRYMIISRTDVAQMTFSCNNCCDYHRWKTMCKGYMTTCCAIWLRFNSLLLHFAINPSFYRRKVLIELLTIRCREEEDQAIVNKLPGESVWRCHPPALPTSGSVWTTSQRGWTAVSRRRPRCCCCCWCCWPPRRPPSPPPCGLGCSPLCSCPEIFQDEKLCLSFRLQDVKLCHRPRFENEKRDILSSPLFHRVNLYHTRSVRNKDFAISVSFARNISGCEGGLVR